MSLSSLARNQHLVKAIAQPHTLKLPDRKSEIEVGLEIGGDSEAFVVGDWETSKYCNLSVEGMAAQVGLCNRMHEGFYDREFFLLLSGSNHFEAGQEISQLSKKLIPSHF